MGKFVLVSRRVIFWALVAGAATFSSPAANAGSRHLHPAEARVHFLATSTCTRNTYFGSEDTYLAEITFLGRGGDDRLARLVDDYPAYRRPISADVLKTAYTRFRLLRDTSCDVAYGEMLMRTAPGDPMAILPVKLEFRPELPRTVQPEEILPCYRIVRR